MKLPLSAGVTPAHGQITTAEQAASQAAELAEKAARSGTFGVGGILIDGRGTIYAEAVNAVVRDGIVCDPTAHAERQLIDWYFAQRDPALPSPSDLIIVTSLDPCAMCAGAILKSGFTAIAVANDPVSGVHESGEPHRMPKPLWREAEARLKLFSGRKDLHRTGGRLTAVDNGPVSADVIVRCERAFKQSLANVRSAIGGAAEHPASPHWRVLSNLPPGVSVPPPGFASVRNINRERLFDLLDENRSCLIDNHGRPILLAESAETSSPARSSVLELIRAYVAVRRHEQETRGAVLPHPRSCSVLQRRPPLSPAQCLLDLGALGSFLEAERYPSPFPLLAYLEDDDHSSAEEYAASLPPLYTDVVRVSTGPLWSTKESKS